MDFELRHKVLVPHVVAFCRKVLGGSARRGTACVSGGPINRVAPLLGQTDGVDLLEVAKGLAVEFERRQMRSHLQCLKQFCSARKRVRAGQQIGPWSEETVLTWAALLRVPPMQHLYQVYQHASACPRCSDTKAMMRVEISWTDGALIRCEGCGLKWLELN